MSGRKTELTPELMTKIVNTLTGGSTVKDTCLYVGIAEKTFFNWLKRGEQSRKGDELFVQFLQSTTHARASGRVAAAYTIRNAAAKGDVAAAEWLLERTDPQNWGRQTKVIIEGGLTPEQVNRLVRAIQGASLTPGEAFEELIREFEQVHSAAGNRPTSAGDE